jgi:hypothetical protein
MKREGEHKFLDRRQEQQVNVLREIIGVILRIIWEA